MAIDDAASTVENTALTIADAVLLANDTDADGQPLAIVAVGNPRHGSVSHTGAQVIFVPETGYRGSAGFEYTVSDGDKTDVGAVTVTVTPATGPGPGNAAPVVATSPGSAEYIEGAPAAVVDPDLAISDADSAALVAATVTLVDCQAQDALALTPPPEGIDVAYDAGRCALELTGTASVAGYQAALRRVSFANAGEAPSTAARTVRFEVDDGAASNRTGSAARALRVVAVDDAPVTVEDTAGVAEDATLTIDAASLLANDSDPDGPSLAVTAVGNAAHGTVSLLGSVVIFVPAHDYFGAAGFEYTVSDGTLGATGSVAITVSPVNDPPVVATQGTALEITEGAGPVAVDPDIAVSDVDSALLAGATIAITAGCSAADRLALASPPAGITVHPYDAGRCALELDGAASVVDYQVALRRVTFANASEDPSTAVRTLRFEVDDGAADNRTGSATRQLRVIAVDDPPVAVNDTARIAEDTPLTIAAATLLANDSDPDGPSLAVTAVGNAQNGTVSLVDGLVTFVPAHDHFGAASFEYTISDGTFGATASVAITVDPVDDPPVAVDDSATLDEDAAARTIDVLANDTDVDGGSMTIASTTQPANGTVVASAGSLTYRPRANYCNDGIASDSFTYTLSPGSSTATVRIAVRCVVDPVVAVNDVATVAQGSAGNRLDVLVNDQNPDGGPITVLAVSAASSGAAVSIAPGGTGILYTPPTGYCNSIANAPRDAFTYSVTGGSSASVAVTVNCPCGPNQP
ncbi:MAG TPA: Ig-like domain-containing protein, partial [Kofleriaceae bacterium]